MKKGIYKHYKGNLYRVHDVVIHSETLEEMVLYESIAKPGLWVRPLTMFKETLLKDGQEIPRFEYIGESVK